MEFLILNYHGFGGLMNRPLDWVDGQDISPRHSMLVEADHVRAAVRQATGHGGHVTVEHNFTDYNLCIVCSDPPPADGGKIWVEVVQRPESGKYFDQAD